MKKEMISISRYYQRGNFNFSTPAQVAFSSLKDSISRILRWPRIDPFMDWSFNSVSRTD